MMYDENLQFDEVDLNTISLSPSPQITPMKNTVLLQDKMTSNGSHSLPYLNQETEIFSNLKPSVKHNEDNKITASKDLFSNEMKVKLSVDPLTTLLFGSENSFHSKSESSEKVKKISKIDLIPSTGLFNNKDASNHKNSNIKNKTSTILFPERDLKKEGDYSQNNAQDSSFLSSFFNSMDFLAPNSLENIVDNGNNNLHTHHLKVINGNGESYLNLNSEVNESSVVNGDIVVKNPSINSSNNPSLSSENDNKTPDKSVVNFVGDKLLLLAEGLVNNPPSLAIADTMNETENKDVIDNLNRTLENEARKRRNIAKSLLILAKLLTGDATVEDYQGGDEY